MIRKYIKYIGSILALLMMGTSAYSQQNEPFFLFHRLDENDGLTNNMINDIEQDSLGFIWTATDDGLFRFDGISFRSFRHSDENHTTLPHNAVQQIHVDEHGRIWALTDYGIGIYDYEKDAFHRILPGQAPGQLSHRSTTSICLFPGNKGYIGTFGGGVLSFAGNRFHPLEVSTDPDSLNLATQLVSQLTIDKDSMLWIGTWNEGLMLYSHDEKSLTRASGLNNIGLRIYALRVLSDESIWVGSNRGLFIFRPGSNAPEHYYSEQNEWLPDNEILTIYEDDQDKIWLGTRKGGMLSLQWQLSPASGGPFVHAFEITPYSFGISHRTVSSLLKDSFGNMWVGTHNTGLNYFNPAGEIIRTFTYIPDRSSLSHQSVWGICEADQSRIWAGTDGGGLNLLDPGDGSINNIPVNGFSDPAILTASVAPDGKLWVGTYSGGINIYDPGSGKVSKPVNGDLLRGLDVRDIWHDNAGNAWIATNGSGLYYYDASNSSFKSSNALEGYDIRSIIVADKDALWLGSFGLGLLYYNPVNDSVFAYNWYQEEDRTPIVLSMLKEDKDIWIGTRQSGLLRFDMQKKEFFRPPVNEKLSNATVRSILKDRQGRIWFSTNLGINCLLPSDSAVYEFNSADGLQVGQFNDGSALLLGNGNLAFGGIHGISIFSPDRLLDHQQAPELRFTEISVFHKDEAAGGLSKLNFPLTSKELELEYSLNSIMLSFNALSIPNADKWVYDMMLSAYDQGWNLRQEGHSVTYRNLAPGTYTFMIRCSDRMGNTKGKITTLNITILPPWYRRIIAWIAYVIIVLVLIFLLVRFYINRVTLKQKLQFEQRLRQQEHIAMLEKTRFFTNFSHELRSPLTLIQGPVRELVDGLEDPGQKTLAQLIRRNTATLMRLVNRLLEFRKIETESTTLNIGRYDLSELLFEETESFRYYSTQTGSSITPVAKEAYFAWVDIDKIRIILNNLISNAVKYTPAGGRIEVRLEDDPEIIRMTVSDTGPGIPSKDQKAIFSPYYQSENSAGKGGTGIGLSLAQNLIELHHGKIELLSSKEGSRFIVYIPKDIRSELEHEEHVRIIESPGKEVEDDLKEAPAGDPVSSDKKVVLLVDDNADIRQYVNHLLERNYIVHTAENGDKGFKLALKEIPDIIISDIMMPEVDGIEMCKKLKFEHVTSHIPFIFLTAKDTDSSRIEGFTMGADAYITKPFTPKLLVTQIENLLSQREKLREYFNNKEWEKDEIEESPDLRFLKHVEDSIISMVHDREITVPNLSSELGYSRTSLYRKIKALTGMSINQFIRSVKIRHAAHLLALEDVTVSEVAFSLGFTDLKYFRTCFKSQYDQLPSEYQKIHREGLT